MGGNKQYCSMWMMTKYIKLYNTTTELTGRITCQGDISNLKMVRKIERRQNLQSAMNYNIH